MRVFFVMALGAGMATGCGGAAQRASTLSAQPDHLLFAVMGGNTSCATDAAGVKSPYGMSLYAPFKKLADSLEAGGGTKVDFFLACYNSDAVVHYYASDAPQTLVDIQATDVPAKLEALAQSGGAKQLYIAGHSYGGWLALKTAVAMPAATKLTGLFSIDPISRVNCTFADPAECTQAPSDITDSEYQGLHDRAGSWVNFFENNTFYLHSSAIQQADDNVEVPDATHYTIEKSAQVWDVLTQKLAAR